MSVKQDMPQISFDVLDRSHELIVVRKPAGYLSTPSRDRNEKRPCLGTILQKELGQQIYPVHRLDFEVSGPLIFALNPKAHSTANGWFENGLIQKTYLAVGEACHIPTDELRWESLLIKGKKRSFEAPYGKPSITLARCLGDYNLPGTSLWKLSPVTGRSHQLRFEMSKRIAPIWGDLLYGSKIAHDVHKMALQCVELNLGQIANKLGLSAIIQDPSRF